MKILIADDQPLVLKKITHELSSSGFLILNAENGQVAIDLYDEHQPDLVMVDLEMPLKSGFEVIEHIKANQRVSTPIIVMSGNNEESSVIDAFNLGVDDYVRKPVGLREVCVRVKRLIANVDSSRMVTGNSNAQIQADYCGIVIPCYNEEERLKTEEFQKFIVNTTGFHICFVNDGSKDNTLAVLQELRKGREDYISIVDCKQNGGKAEAVRQGILSMAFNDQFDYVGYLDADLSTNFSDFEDLTRTISKTNYKIVSGSRINRMGANIAKEDSRAIISVTINKIIQKILGMKFQDTQCGAKVMTKDVAQLMFAEPFDTRWLFDVEIFLRMKKHFGKDKVQNMICEQPLKRWVHEDGSKLSMKDSFKILWQLFQIALKR